MFESVRFGAGSEKIRVFVSYDREHDGDLHDRIVEQASKTSGFEISARSRARAPVDFLDEGLHREIREADEVIIICGEHTDCSERMGTELRIGPGGGAALLPALGPARAHVHQAGNGQAGG